MTEPTLPVPPALIVAWTIEKSCGLDAALTWWRIGADPARWQGGLGYAALSVSNLEELGLYPRLEDQHRHGKPELLPVACMCGCLRTEALIPDGRLDKVCPACVGAPAAQLSIQNAWALYWHVATGLPEWVIERLWLRWIKQQTEQGEV